MTITKMVKIEIPNEEQKFCVDEKWNDCRFLSVDDGWSIGQCRLFGADVASKRNVGLNNNQMLFLRCPECLRASRS